MSYYSNVWEDLMLTFADNTGFCIFINIFNWRENNVGHKQLTDRQTSCKSDWKQGQLKKYNIFYIYFYQGVCFIHT